MPAGRPTDYTAEMASRICDRIAAGDSLRRICADDAMPGARTVYQWLAAHEEFAQQYAYARDEQADHYADEIIEIADTDEDSQRARVRIDARKWKASKLQPKKYGDRVVQEHVGNDGGAIEVNVSNKRRAQAILTTIAKAKRERTDP